MTTPRYVVQRNEHPQTAINSHPWRVWDTQEERSAGWYASEEDADLMCRFLNGPQQEDEEE